MTPRLAVTQKQAEVVESVLIGPNGDQAVLRLPERPTMLGESYHHVRAIPEGTRVEVGWWEHGDDTLGCWMKWHPVAFATLTSVEVDGGPVSDAVAPGPRPASTPASWTVTLSDIKPVEADQ